MKARTPLLLLILDGWGIRQPSPNNAISLARPQTYLRLLQDYPNTKLRASGTAVGLPAKQAGNSEAGHMNLGAGRVVEQDAVRINKEITNGLFFRNSAFLDALRFCSRHHGQLHLMGLLTGQESGHAFPLHLNSLLKLAITRGNPTVQLHLFTDGRDSAKYAAIELLHGLEKRLNPNQHIATVIGRLWGMDRAKRWARTEQAYNAMVLGRGRKAKTAEAAVLAAYKRGESDEFLSPTVIGDAAAVRNSRVREGDAVIFFNLRSDRAREITKVFAQDGFERSNPGSFRRKKILKNIRFVAMTDFGPDLPNILTAYPSINLEQTLVHALADVKQLYIAESEKFAHITYFFNGGHADAVAGEDRVMVPSYNVESYDKVPEMCTPEITRRILRVVKNGTHDVIVANFANADMVAHTGNLEAGILAVQSIDRELARIVPAILAKNGTIVITGDHGNIEDMLNLSTGEVDTEHNPNPVPLLVIGAKGAVLPKGGALADVAPTVLRLLGKTPPKAMTGHNLLRK